MVWIRQVETAERPAGRGRPVLPGAAHVAEPLVAAPGAHEPQVYHGPARAAGPRPESVAGSTRSLGPVVIGGIALVVARFARFANCETSARARAHWQPPRDGFHRSTTESAHITRLGLHH